MMDENDKKHKQLPKGPLLRGPRTLILWLLIIISSVFILMTLRGKVTVGGREYTEADLIRDIERGRVEKLIFSDEKIKVKLVSGTEKDEFIVTTNIRRINYIKDLADKYQVAYDNRPPNKLLRDIVLWFGSAILFFLLIYFVFFRQMKAASGGSILSFGKSRARKVAKEKVAITFEHVAGIEEAKEEVKEIIEFLRNPAKIQKLGGRIPRGVMLIGPPGCGKTLLAKAIAGEADVPFFSISGSDFVEMFVGVGASRVRDLFREAKESSPCLIFLDEIDAVGRKRGHGWGGGHDEREQTLNAILVEMDGFETDSGVIVIAATNRPDILDPALLRPGRFDRQIMISLPDLKGREEILKVHASKIKLAPEADLRVLARGTPMFSGADLEAIINEAAILAAMKEKDAVGMTDLEESRDKVKWGRQKSSMVMDEEDKKITAYHEAGHALASKIVPDSEPLHKVSIVPRGMALGETMQLPEKDRYHLQRKNAVSMIKVLYGGRIAEELLTDDISSGAQNDIRHATEIARAMVREWGMSESLGPVSYADSEEKLYGGEVLLSKSYSEATAIEIDKEVKKILDACYDEIRKELLKRKTNLEGIAKALLKYEILTAKEVDVILEGKELVKEVPEPAEKRSKKAEAKKTGKKAKKKIGDVSVSGEPQEA